MPGHIFIEGKNYGYTLCRDAADMERRVLSLYRDEIIPAIRAGLGGAVYTQISDVEDETNGFYTYDRTLAKIAIPHFAEIRKEIDTVLSECTEKGENHGKL